MSKEQKYVIDGALILVILLVITMFLLITTDNNSTIYVIDNTTCEKETCTLTSCTLSECEDNKTRKRVTNYIQITKETPNVLYVQSHLPEWINESEYKYIQVKQGEYYILEHCSRNESYQNKGVRS